MPVIDLPVAQLVVEHRLRVPRGRSTGGDAVEIARALDVTLLSVGFKATPTLLRHLGQLQPAEALVVAETAVAGVRRLVGDHVAHNVYFRDFPAGVPDTVRFWHDCVTAALDDDAVAGTVRAQLSSGFVDLLSLPTYGRYQHSYEEMLAAHEPLLPVLSQRLRLVDLGDALDEEAHRLYLELAERRVPLSDTDASALLALARHFVDGPHPAEVPVRENRALLNRAAVEVGRDPVADTVTDVLRLAAALSGADHTLRTPPRFVSLSRPVRRLLVRTLDEVVRSNPARLADVPRHREMWKRLGERLHPGDHPGLTAAQRVFAVARGDERVVTLPGRVEQAFASRDLEQIVDALLVSPGMLLRTADRLLRTVAPEDVETALAAVVGALPRVPGRLVLSLREHLMNREQDAGGQRVFVNRVGGGWVTADRRGPLGEAVVERLAAACDAEILRRSPRPDRVVVDPAMLQVALPLSGRSSAGGVGALPRGSRTPVDARVLRFFVHWRQASERTDLDLSCLLLDRHFVDPDHVSWTRLRGDGFVHSGDITEAPLGASEFVDVDLAEVAKDVLVPQVLVFSGERFDQLAEGFFGYMARDPAQRGQPFEPSTVRLKSDLTGPGRVLVPMVFVREGDGWSATWLHLQVRGRGAFTTVEAGRASTSTLAQAISRRRHVTVDYLLDLWASAGVEVVVGPEPESSSRPGMTTLRIGLDELHDALDGTTSITPRNLTDLVPA